ncbi:hypothetical protein [Acinetobacter sp. YH12075]|uniref:hypothetical protein n=1 Tax=Acinetobacter sp. YH12075 TaxID=2601070 RepID=UPI0015D2A61A|nr:hypothetical protein [Acinetobacter sp. YH12075]
MVVHLFLNNNKALDFLPINSIKNGGITMGIFPVNPKRMESAQSLAEYGIKEGWSSDKLQKEVSKELRGRDPQGEAYVGAIVNGSVVIASVTPLGSGYRIYQGGKWVFYTAKQVAGSAALRNTVKSAMLNGTISGGISAASGDDVQGIIANTAFGAAAGSMSTWNKGLQTIKGQAALAGASNLGAQVASNIYREKDKQIDLNWANAAAAVIIGGAGTKLQKLGYPAQSSAVVIPSMAINAATAGNSPKLPEQQSKKNDKK